MLLLVLAPHAYAAADVHPLIELVQGEGAERAAFRAAASLIFAFSSVETNRKARITSL
jgi:hypothetical protein